MRKAFASLGFIACAFCAVVHLATFFGVDPMMKWPFLWVLHLVAMAMCVTAFFSGNNLRSRKSMHKSHWTELFDSWDMAESRVALERLEHDDPVADAILVRRFRSRPLAIVLYCLAAYVPVNFVLGMALMDGGSADQREGSYRLVNHGQVVRQLTESEYRWHRAVETRTMTGHWMAFLFGTALLWMAPRHTLPRKD